MRSRRARRPRRRPPTAAPRSARGPPHDRRAATAWPPSDAISSTSRRCSRASPRRSRTRDEDVVVRIGDLAGFEPGQRRRPLRRWRRCWWSCAPWSPPPATCTSRSRATPTTVRSGRRLFPSNLELSLARASRVAHDLAGGDAALGAAHLGGGLRRAASDRVERATRRAGRRIAGSRSACRAPAEASRQAARSAAAPVALAALLALLGQVQRRDPVGLGQRREVEDVLDERVDVEARRAAPSARRGSARSRPRRRCARRAACGRSPSATSFRSPSVMPAIWPRATSSKRARPTSTEPWRLQRLGLVEADGGDLGDGVDADRRSARAGARARGRARGTPRAVPAPWRSTRAPGDRSRRRRRRCAAGWCGSARRPGPGRARRRRGRRRRGPRSSTLAARPSATSSFSLASAVPSSSTGARPPTGRPSTPTTGRWPPR